MKLLLCLCFGFSLATVACADGVPTLAVAPFGEEGVPGLGKEVSAEIATRMAGSRDLRVVERSQFAQAAAEVGLQVNNPEMFDAANASKVGKWLQAQFVVVGEVTRIASDYIVRARCLQLETNTVVPGAAVSKRGGDWQFLATDAAEVIHARLTGGSALAAEAMDQRVRNDRSPTRLLVRFEQDRQAQDAGKRPIYYKDDLVRLQVTSSEAGHLLVVGVGANEVYQLFPPCPTVRSEVAANRPLSIPNQAFADCGYDPAGFELVGDEPAVEQVHAFFSHRPITMKLPDPQLDPTAEAMSPARYYAEFVPSLRAELDRTDPLWNGTSTAYFYGVDRSLAAEPPAIQTPTEPQPQQDTAAQDPNAAAALARGPEIRVPEAVGAAMIEGRTIEQARDLALLDAQRVALESGVGVMLRSTSRVEQFELLEDTIELKSQTGYVRVEQILDEQQRDGAFLIKIAAVVSANPVIGAMGEHDELKALYEDLERPRIVCLIAEDANGERSASGGAAETRLIERLRERGLDVVDATQLAALAERDKVQQALTGNAEAAQWVQTTFDSEIIIGGQAKAVPREGLVGAQVLAELNLKAVQTSDARVLASAQRTFVPPPQPAGDGGIIARKALALTVDALIQPEAGLGFIDQMVADWVSRPTELTVKVARADRAGIAKLVAALAPQPVALGTIKVDAITGEGLRGRPALFNAADVVTFTPALSTVRVRSPLRPRRARGNLETAIEQLGWQVTGMAGTLLDVTAQ